MFIPSVHNTYRAHALTQAMNDWTIQRWFPVDDRFYGLVIVANQTPLNAAAEIRRSGQNDRMVGVLMAANGLSNLWATRSTIQYMRPQQKWICRSSCMPEATDHQTLSAIRPPGGYQPPTQRFRRYRLAP